MCYRKIANRTVMVTPQTSSERIDQTKTDCVSDLQESLYLLTDAKKRLTQFLWDIKKTKQHINPSTYTESVATAEGYMRTLAHKIDAVKTFLKTLLHAPPSLPLIAHAAELKELTHEYLRTHLTQYGALITGTDWQSPSFDHAVRSQAGRETGTIYATINDYKRDQNWDASRYERAFVKEYINNIIKFPIHACAMSSGMAAFTTILSFLVLEDKATRPILMGKSSWFENKAFIERAFGKRVISVNEHDTKKILEIIATEEPSVIFFDSLTNASDVAMPDLNTIIPYLEKNAGKETYLVIDNTCLSLFLQPLQYIFGKRSKVRLIVFESLNKYHQFGMDRVTGGLVWSYGGDTINIFDYRRHLGTNMPDILAASLPTPNKEVLSARLLRHQRNALFLAQALQTWIDTHPSSPFEKVLFPGLPNHTAFKGIKTLPFTGSFFVIKFTKKYQTVTVYKRFIETVMRLAKRRKVNIVAGSTFGLNQTRVYLTALYSNPSMPFIRVAVGTEHRIAIEAVKNILINVFCTFL